MPSSRRLRFTPDADADFESLLQYTVQTWGEHQMHAYADTIYGVLDELGVFPDIGKQRDDLFPGAMSYPAGEHVVISSATDQELILYRIIHGRRDIDAAFRR